MARASVVAGCEGVVYVVEAIVEVRGFVPLVSVGMVVVVGIVLLCAMVGVAVTRTVAVTVLAAMTVTVIVMVVVAVVRDLVIVVGVLWQIVLDPGLQGLHDFPSLACGLESDVNKPRLPERSRVAFKGILVLCLIFAHVVGTLNE